MGNSVSDRAQTLQDLWDSRAAQGSERVQPFDCITPYYELHLH